MSRDERLKLIRAEREAEYLREKADREDGGIVYISIAPIQEIKDKLAELHNQPIEIA